MGLLFLLLRCSSKMWCAVEHYNMRFTGSTNTIENEEVVPVVNFVMAEQEKRSDMYFVGFHLFFSSSLFDCLSLLLCGAKEKNEGAESYTTYWYIMLCHSKQKLEETSYYYHSYS